MRLEELIGRRVGRYQVAELVGRGGMAAVYRASDTALLRDVALKVLYPQYAHDQALVERFQHEAVVAARLDHPSIVPIYDVGEADGLTYIAMKLLGTRSLGDLLRDRGSLTLDELAPIVDQIASALDYAHARGVVHRDIKPANILLEGLASAAPHLSRLDPGVRAVLTDFGIARSLDTPGLTGTGVLIGTPDYMAPEQIRGDRGVDGRADIYALGVLIYRCLTGRRPFEGTTQEVLIGHLEGAPLPPSAFDAALPVELDYVVRRAMARRPTDRYATAGELAAAFRLAAGLEPLTPPPGTMRAAEPRAVAPRVATERMAARTPPDQPTARGDARPPQAAPPEPQARPATSEAPARRRRFGPVALMLGVLLALVAGGGLLVAQQMRGSAASPTLAPPATSAPLAPPSATPSLTPEPSPSPEPTVEPSPEPATAAPAATEAPTATRAAPTRTRVTPTATRSPATPSASPTSTAGATPTATEPPASATPSATLTATLTATPCPVAMAGGFATLWERSAELQRRLGCATRLEVGGTIVEQPFQNGSMYYFSPLELIYTLEGFETGRWRVYSQADLLGLPTPTPAPPPSEGLSIPVGGFGLVWGTYAEVREALGLATLPETGSIAGARQPFERGVMIWSASGLNRGSTIYVLYNDGAFERYDDPNP